MNDLDFFKVLVDSLGDAGNLLATKATDAFNNIKHGDFAKWLQMLEQLPPIEPSSTDINSSAIGIGLSSDCDDQQRQQIAKLLQEYHPWRKGPFEVFGVKIDTEWRSDIKWDRLIGQIEPLNGRRVLDVGCGSGYHCLRAVGEGAKIVVGIDPFLLFVMQFKAINKYLKLDNVSVLPLGVEDMPVDCGCFDTVFSMGVLYHRRNPVEHIRELRGFLDDGGQLVLETLIIEDDASVSLSPEGRYAKMRNVWQIPSPALMLDWLAEAGLKDARIIDVSKTTALEQRKTDWMRFESLADFLDPCDSTKTIEGHPAPVRAVAVATK